MEKVSVIVPVFNAEPCLKKCIESILNQTYQNLELVLIDDGSTDGSAKIIEAYARENERIIAIYQKNSGVSAARNAGLKNVTGKYICFVDADDFVENIFCEALVSNLEESKTELACCNWDYVYDNREKEIHEVHEILDRLTVTQFIEHLFKMPITVGGSVCNKLFLKEKIVCLFDEHVSVCEDNLFLLNYCFNIQNVCYINQSLYHIYDYSESSMRSNPDKIINGLEVREQMIELVRHYNSELKAVVEGSYLDTCYLYYNKYKKKNRENYLIAIERIRQYIGKNVVSVLLNNKIYWKTKILYFIKCLFA